MCLIKTSLYPCGRCYECLSKRRSDWSIRLQEEWKHHQFGYHAILTYRDENLKLSKNGIPQVNKRDCQLFLKRLRHKFDNHISYFLATEYGEFTERPHVHIGIFGVPWFDDVKQVGNDYYSENLRKLIEDCWQLGFVRYKSKYIVSTAQIHYLTKDIYNWTEPRKLFEVLDKLKYLKKQKLLDNFMRNTFNAYLRAGCVDDREPNFRLMSKNLGLDYIQDRKEVPFEIQLKYADCFRPLFEDGKRVFYKDFLPFGPFNVRKKLLNEFEFNELGEFLPPVDVMPYIRGYDCNIMVNEKDNTKRLRSAELALPRYYRERIFSYDIAAFISLFYYTRSEIARKEYLRKNGDYDLRHDIPYCVESAAQSFPGYFKSHKDKYVDKSKYHDG